MTVLRTRRGRLDRALKNKRLTLVLFAGDTGSQAEKAYALAQEKIREPFRRHFLIKDLELLSAAERRDWFDALERYAVLEHKSASATRKAVRAKGPVSDFRSASGRLSSVVMRGVLSS